MNIGMIGYGWIGKATERLFGKENIKIYDKFLDRKDDLSGCDIVFVAVPTPLDHFTDRLDCSAVEDAIQNCSANFFVIRSATNPGFADYLSVKYKKIIVVMPEFLGETPSHPMNMDCREFIILGGEDKDCRKVIELYTSVYNAGIKIRTVSRKEAEIIKLTNNRAAFFKVMQCQELYDACEAEGVDYYKIRDAVFGDDPRHNLLWTFIYPNNRGVSSKCIPKDIYAWVSWSKAAGSNPIGTKYLLEYNKKLLMKNT